jgi:hypothetical protein
MEITATRTLVKSAPELWELLDDEPQLRHWSSRLCNGDAAVEVTARHPGERLAWRSDGMRAAEVEVTLAVKDFGTQVAISAEAEGELEEAALERVLDELAEPQRRPFGAA